MSLLHFLQLDYSCIEFKRAQYYFWSHTSHSSLLQQFLNALRNGYYQNFALKPTKKFAGYDCKPFTWHKPRATKFTTKHLTVDPSQSSGSGYATASSHVFMRSRLAANKKRDRRWQRDVIATIGQHPATIAGQHFNSAEGYNCQLLCVTWQLSMHVVYMYIVNWNRWQAWIDGVSGVFVIRMKRAMAVCQDMDSTAWK